MADASITTNSIQNNSGAACYRCRGFRHACDRTKPACSRCKRRGITCQYPEAAPTLKKLQKATETLSDRIKKFGDLLKTGENGGFPNKTKDFGISLQRLAQPRGTVVPAEVSLPSSSSSSVVFSSQASIHSDLNSDVTMEEDTFSIKSNSTDSTIKSNKVVSTSSFSIYPCSKCFKDLQQCDLTLPKCGRCAEHSFECIYSKTEPKANHVSQVLTTMNKVMDQWQDSIDKMAKDFAQKTRDFGQRMDQSFKKKPLQPFAWKITTTNKGLSVESNVHSFNDFSKLVDQFKRAMHISTRESESKDPKSDDIRRKAEIDDASSINTSSGFSFGAWNPWSHPAHTSPDQCPVAITQELTDSLIELYCRTPCCSSIRLPIIDSKELLARYHDENPERRPSSVLIYTICALVSRNAFQTHIWGKRHHDESSYTNIGKALSIAYCLKAREELSECFDEPNIDNCKAAFLLSYCTGQNGYYNVTYIYEWISFTMAKELGLYDENRELTITESMLVWCIYYHSTWYRLIEGDCGLSDSSDQFCPRTALVPPPPKPDSGFMDTDDVDFGQKMIDYYIYSKWYYTIQLQVLRHELMTRLVQAQALGKQDTNLCNDLLSMQEKLQTFYATLPLEWQNPDLESISQEQILRDASSLSPDSENELHYHQVDIKDLARLCILHIHVYYNINKILLYQVFLPLDHMPTTPFSVQCLNTCTEAAYAITQTLDIMVKSSNECSIPLITLLFANMIYKKLLLFERVQFHDFATRCLEQSVNICKMSKMYLYEFEVTRNLVKALKQDVYDNCSSDTSIYTPDEDMFNLDEPFSTILKSSHGQSSFF